MGGAFDSYKQLVTGVRNNLSIKLKPIYTMFQFNILTTIMVMRLPSVKQCRLEICFALERLWFGTGWAIFSRSYA